MKHPEKIASLMDGACGTVFPGATSSVFHCGKEVFSHAAGSHGYGPQFESRTTLETIYDIASLTKPMSTVTIAMSLMTEGSFSLEDPLSDFFETQEQAFDTIRVYHLLAHSSGLPAWRGFGAELLKAYGTEKAGSEEIKRKFIDKILQEKPVYLTGRKSHYSDLGFVLLGEILENRGRSSIDLLFEKYVSTPLGLSSSFYIKSNQKPEMALLERIAPTEFCPIRKRLIHGEVHDDNAYALGGVAGHAGLFSTSREVARWANELLCAYLGKKSAFASLKEAIRLFWSKRYSPAGSSWNLGFDSRSAFGSSSGRYFSPSSVGHLGFTGCSIWIDPDVELVVVLLTNRVHPSRENDSIRKFRPKFHDTVYKSI